MNTDAGALLKLADDLENFGHCWCLEERRRATIIAALRQAASHGRAGDATAAQEAGNCGDIEQLRASNDQRGNDLVTVIAQRDAAETALRAVVRDLVSISERYRAIALPSAEGK